MNIQIYDEEKQIRIRKGEEPFYYPVTYSRIDRYEECPLWFKFEYVDKLGKIGSDKADLGTALHVFQELLFTDGIERANEIASAMVPLSMSDDWQNAKAIIEQISIKKDYLYAVEARFRYEFPALRVPPEGEPEKWTIQVEAKIDQAFVYPERGILEVVDGKSGRGVERSVESDIQLKLYCLAAWRNLEDLGIHTVIGTQAQWRFGRLVSASWSIEELKEFEVEIQRISTDMLNETRFKPKPAIPHCLYCPFSLRCDAAQKLLPKEVTIGGKTLPVIIDSYEAAEQVGSGIIHLEAVIKRYRDSLRGFVREYQSPVTVGDKTYDWHRHKTLKVGNLEKLMEIAEKEGVDLSDYLSFNNRTGKTLIKDHPKIRQGLVEDQHSRFELRKPGEESED